MGLSGEKIGDFFFYFQCIMIGISIVGAFLWRKDEGALRWCRLIKLCQIPYYVVLFGLGCICAFFFLIPLPFMIVVAIGGVAIIVISNCILLACTSMYGVFYLLRQKASFGLILRHFIFVLDVFAAWKACKFSDEYANKPEKEKKQAKPVQEGKV